MQYKEEIDNLFKSYSTLMKNAVLDFCPSPSDSHGKTSTLIVTDECNLRCTYCYLTDKKPTRMSWDVAKSFIDMTFKNNQHLAEIPIDKQLSFDHAKIWDFVGGEPFLESDLIFKCVEYIYTKTMSLSDSHPWKHGFICPNCPPPSHRIFGFRFSFSTNGTLLNDPKIRKQLERWQPYISLGVSIDGPKEMHDACRITIDGKGSFDLVMNNWEWYRKHFPSNASTTKSTISHDNLTQIGSIAKFFWEDLKMPYISMNCVFENVWHKGDQLILFDQLCDLADYLMQNERWKKIGIRWFNPMLGTKDTSDSKWCGAGTHMDACGYNGYIYPCLRFKSLDKRPSFDLGHIDDGHKDEKKIAILDVPNCHHDNIQLQITGVDCSACPISSICASCQAFSYDTYGRADIKAIFICPMHKANVFANMYLMGNILGWLTPKDRDYILLLLDDFTQNDYFGFDGDGTPVPMYKGESI